jgi:hypothetical protein
MEDDPTLVLGMMMGMWETASSANEVGFVMRAMTHLTLLTDFGVEPNEWIANADRVIDHRMTRTRDLEDRFEGIVKQNDAAHQKFSEFLVQSSGQWDGKCKEFDTKRHEIEDLYHKKLATHAAVKYWQDRAEEQRAEQETWQNRFLGIAASVFIIVIGLWWFLKPIEAVVNTPSGNMVLTVAQLIQTTLGVRILIIVFGIWICRLCVRNYLSARHHGADAEERVAMIKTYLAMLKDDDISKNEDLRKMTLPAVLQVIFRHTQDGYVKDDAIPLNSISIGGGKSS